jgi:hypothetical protein
MARRRSPHGPDIRDVKPTRVLMSVTLTIDGGTLSHQEISDVWMGLQHAFQTAAHKAGLGYSWAAELKCTTPTRMDATIKRFGYEVEFPPANIEPLTAERG